MNGDQSTELPEVESLHTEELVTPQAAPEPEPRLAIYMSMAAYQAIGAHADSDLSQEVMGLLLGSVRHKAGGLEVTIHQALKGQETLSTGFSVQLSYESWKRFIKEKSTHHPDLATVGWYHTHPGFGTFLSSMDELIHKNFFAKAWQVALVVDPIQGHWTFFQHQAGEIERCQQFMLVVPDNTSPGGLGGRTDVSLTPGKGRQRHLLGILNHARSSLQLAPRDKYRQDWLADTPTLSAIDCQRVVSWTKTPLYVAVTGQRAYWMPSTRLLRVATGPGDAAEHHLERDVDAIAPAADGTALYLLSVDQAEIWVFRPDEPQPFQALPIESEEVEDVDSYQYQASRLAERYRLACIEEGRLIVATSSELAVLAARDAGEGYRVAHQRQLAPRAFWGLEPLRPLPFVPELGVVLPDQIRGRLNYYDPLGKRDGHLTVSKTRLDLPSDVVYAGQHLVISDSARERILVSSLKGRLIRQFRLTHDVRQRLYGLLGGEQSAYLVLSDGLWRCHRLLEEET